MGTTAGGGMGKGNWADPTGLVQKMPSGLRKITDPLGLTSTQQGESAADRAARMEMERQARIGEAQKRINSVFDNPNRKGEIADFVSALRDFQMQDLDRQKASTDRELRFAMARGGLTGGSVNVDKNREFAEDYLRGRLNVENRALGAGADLEARDQDARARLIQLATSGMDTTTAAQQAAASMGSNLESARASAYGQQMGDQFAGFGKFIKDRREEAMRRQANRDAGMSLYGGGG